jgi:hypothetical protein
VEVDDRFRLRRWLGLGAAIVMMFVGYTLKAHSQEAGRSWGEAALWGLAILGFGPASSA